MGRRRKRDEPRREHAEREKECIRFENVRAVLSAFATTGQGPRAHLHLFYPPNSIDLAGLFGEFSS
jgi:hypothetical protein